MKKRVVIGDLHGCNLWEAVIEKENPDFAIFLGDYFDSFTLPPISQKDNFDNLLKAKRDSNKCKYILLLGNHDFHYLCSTMHVDGEQYSGYNKETQRLIGYYDNILDKCLDNDISIAYIDYINHTIYSHAGVTQKWMDLHIGQNCLSLINNVSLKSLRFTNRESGDWFGYSEYSSPIWVRPEGLLKNPYKDKDGKTWNQIFGHTHKKHPAKDIKDNAEFWNMDCLEQDWYMVENLDEKGKLISRYVKQTFTNVEIF